MRVQILYYTYRLLSSTVHNVSIYMSFTIIDVANPDTPPASQVAVHCLGSRASFITMDQLGSTATTIFVLLATCSDVQNGL